MRVIDGALNNNNDAGNNPSRGRASTHLPDRSADLQSPQGFLMPNKQQCRSVDGRWYVARCGVWGSIR